MTRASTDPVCFYFIFASTYIRFGRGFYDRMPFLPSTVFTEIANAVDSDEFLRLPRVPSGWTITCPGYFLSRCAPLDPLRLVVTGLSSGRFYSETVLTSVEAVGIRLLALTSHYRVLGCVGTSARFEPGKGTTPTVTP